MSDILLEFWTFLSYLHALLKGNTVRTGLDHSLQNSGIWSLCDCPLFATPADFYLLSAQELYSIIVPVDVSYDIPLTLPSNRGCSMEVGRWFI